MIIVCFCLCLDLGDSPTGNQTLQEAKQGKYRCLAIQADLHIEHKTR